MGDYTIIFARSARKELEALDPALIGRILPRIEELSADPRPPGCAKLSGGDDLWRVRVGDYRVLYSLSDASRTVRVIAVRHRGRAYR